ncbi:MAG: sel1 repeat family protein, partial [Synergistaceae bacterium]|nr:sel1 repeat family protein [Synergistaceae bacterium]MBR2208268.1 sel1 repeat family protein [Synergistaceae bacterium]
LPFLLTDSVVRNNVWAFHPTIMNYMGMYDYVPLYVENKAVTIPLRFELPEEYQDITAEINAKLVFEDDFAEAALKTRNALHNAAISHLTKKVNKSVFASASEIEYPLAQVAVDSVEANEILNTKGRLLDESINRLEGLRGNENHTVFYNMASRLEREITNYENQKKCVPFYTQAAMTDPDAMIRMGEIYEQGFYDVKPNPKRADSYYKEGIRILSLLASQGMPSAAAQLGHVYIEGLGTKQDIQRAERYYQFAEKAGYEDSEFWLWKKYGIAVRQVKMPQELVDWFNERGVFHFNSYRIKNIPTNPRTCLYLIRENTLVTSARVCYLDSNNMDSGESVPLVNIKSANLCSLARNGEWEWDELWLNSRKFHRLEFRGKNIEKKFYSKKQQ